jgi:xylulokinase
MNVLGVDAGTSALKAIIVDERQSIVAEASVPLRTSVPRPGWSEQDPQDWWDALEEAVGRLRSRRPEALAQVRALGLSGQMHAAVLVEASGAPIRSAILWNDGRAVAECAELHAAVPDLARIAGVIAMPGLTAPKLLWLARHEPQSVGRAWKLLGAKDFLRLRLTGEAVTDMSDAAGTLWLDEAARGWSGPVVAASGLEPAQLPNLAEATATTGALRQPLAKSWGIDGPVVVAGGAGDVAAAAVGIGAVEDGDAFVSIGTSAQFFRADSAYRPQPETLLHAFAHALPQRWFRMAAMLNGANCLDLAARLVGETDIARLLERTEAGFRGPSRLLFLPYLSGERTPRNDPLARGVYFGLDATTEPTDLVQATLEGVAFSLREAQELFGATGVAPGAIPVVGGGARSRFWMQLLANVLGRPVERYAGSDKGPAFGAARLARIALTGEEPAAICTKPPVEDTFDPDPALTAAYAERFERYRSLYRALKAEFRADVGWAKAP